MNNNPIGIFDSGVGGISVLKSIREQLPNESFIYVADSAHAPYGDKSDAFLEQRSIDITQFLINNGAKAIVVACNTATASAVSKLRCLFNRPIVAMEPAIKPATGLSKTGVVGILATAATISSEKYSKLVNRFEHKCRFISQPCPGLVEQIEQGELHGEPIETLLLEYITPLLAQGVDTLVLGCTHYPLVTRLIESIAGNHINVVDGNAAVAVELERQLQKHQLLASQLQQSAKHEQFWSSGNLERSHKIIMKLWHPQAMVKILPVAAEPVI